MAKEQDNGLSSFICYNCNEKNYYDKKNYINAGDADKIKSGIKEVEIECKNCRESNSIRIEI
jgi:hypothetical protein